MSEEMQNESLLGSQPAVEAAVVAAVQPLDESPVHARLAEVEKELKAALDFIKAMQDEPVSGDPEAHLEAAKKILVEYDQQKSSQNAKDAIQNINYALAACKREHT